jgi:hypothetical protein
MNHSIYSADRTTHLKIVVVALVAGIGVAGVGLLAHTNVGDEYAQRVIKAGKPSLRFALALPARQDNLSDLTHVDRSPVLSGTQIK